MKPENLTMKMAGGPFPGIRMINNGEYEWPLPDRLEAPEGSGGYYKKVSESQIEERVDHPNLRRGAQYEWVEE